MMSEEVKFVPYEVALQIVGNVIEEEHLHEENRRILTVYDKRGRSCAGMTPKRSWPRSVLRPMPRR